MAVTARLDWNDEIHRKGYNKEKFNMRERFSREDPSGQFAVLGDNVDKLSYDIEMLKRPVESAYAIIALREQNLEMNRVIVQQEKELKEMAGKLLDLQRTIDKAKTDYIQKQLRNTHVQETIYNNHGRRIENMERQLKNMDVSVQKQLHGLEIWNGLMAMLQINISILIFFGLAYLLGVVYRRLLKRMAIIQHFH